MTIPKLPVPAQPQWEGARLNPNHPFAGWVTLLHSGFQIKENAASGPPGAPTNITRSVGVEGIAWAANATTNDGIVFGSWPPLSKPTWTIFALCAPANSATRKVAFSLRANSGNFEQTDLVIGASGLLVADGRGVEVYHRNTAGDVFVADNNLANGIPDGAVHLYGATKDSSGVIYVWQDSIDITGSRVGGTPSGTFYSSSQTLTLGNLSGYTSDGTFAGVNPIFLLGVLDGLALDATTWPILTANPWGLFDSLDIPLPLPSGATTHTTTGDLAAAAATVAGTAAHLTLHTATGDLVAGAATVTGSAVHPHTTTGVLAAGEATVAGTATHLGLHTTIGALEAGAATVAGTADHTAAAGSHDTTGALAADAAVVVGTAIHLTLHTTTGALVAGSATIHGEATGPNLVVIHYGNLGWRPEKFATRKRRWEVEGLRQELADAINGVAPPSAPKSTPTKIYVPAAASPALETALLRTRKAAASPAVSDEIAALRAAIDTARVEAKRQTRRRKQQEQLLLM
jgi:hypothetical protein